jgi:nitroreductase
MEIPFSDWYPSIIVRRSRRQYDDSLSIPKDTIDKLQQICTEFRPFPEARTVLVLDSPDKVFKGAIGPYGKVKGAPAFLAFIGDTGSSHIHETVGYTGEGVVLEATSRGLATCWVAGFFKQQVAAGLAKAAGNERVLAVSPVGYPPASPTVEERIMTGFGRTHKRKPLESLVTGLDKSEWPGWIETALQSARLAPSAVNRQPWRFRVEASAITVLTPGTSPDFSVSKRLDCGIAMLHIEVAALSAGIKGKWDLLESPEVARFQAVPP